MSITYTLALALIIVGILLNLKLQDAMAEGDGPDWELRTLHSSTPVTSARDPR